jgi:hypothetical protein
MSALVEGAGGVSTGNVYIGIQFYDNVGTPVGTRIDIVTSGNAVNGVWLKKEGYITVPATAALGAVILFNYQPTVTNCYLVFDQIVVQRMGGGVRNSTADVVIDEAGITVTNGSITVTNAGATVIIDGTSNMFKIMATGTLTRSFPSVATGYADTAVNISGSGSTPRPILWHMAVDNAIVDNARYSGYAHIMIAENTAARAYGVSEAGTICHAKLACESIMANPGVTATARYYMLVEAGF